MEGKEPKRSEEHTSELQSRENLVCRLLLEKKNRSPARAVAAGRSCRAACTGPARRAGRGAAAGGGGRDADGVGVRNPLPGGTAGLGGGGRAHARVPAAQRPVPVEP